jgi:hypothetical protein
MGGSAVTVRVMKARRSSLLACGCYVRCGQQIVKPDGRQWACMDCFLGTQDETFLRQLANRTGDPRRLKTVPPLDYDGKEEG